MILLSFALLLSSEVFTDESSASEAELRQVVRESNDCLLREVRQRLDGKTSITNEERSAIRMASANACYEYNEKLARFVLSDGSTTLREVSESMLVDSIRIADAFIATELEDGSE